MRIKDYQILIPKYNSNSGTWRDARDVYENDHPGYVPKYGDWRCVLCHNVNFQRRKLCNNPNCKAPKDYTLTKAENKDVAAPVTGKKEEDSNVACSLEDSSKEKDDHKDATLTKAVNKDDATPITGKKEEDANVTQSIEYWMNLIREAENMTANDLEDGYKVCLCGELIKIVKLPPKISKWWSYSRKWRASLEDDDDCKQHLKCLGKNIANKLNGTVMDKWTMCEVLIDF